MGAWLSGEERVTAGVVAVSGPDGFFEDGELELLFCDAEFFAVVEALGFAGADKAVAFVPVDQFFADADDGDMDMSAVMEAGVAVGGKEELFTNAGILPGRQDAEEAEIAFFSLYLQIHAAEDGVVGAGVF